MIWESDSERVAAWKRANPEKHKEQGQRHYLKHTERIKTRVKEWAKNNPKIIKALKQRFIEKNPSYHKDYSKKYYEKHQETIIETTKQWYIENQDKVKDYNENNKDHIKKRRRVYYLRNRVKIAEQYKQKVQQERSNKIKKN